MNWQPIETAPKFIPFEESPPRCLVYSREYGVQMGSAGTDARGYKYVHINNVSGDVSKIVTHWMPLPPPPEANE